MTVNTNGEVPVASCTPRVIPGDSAELALLKEIRDSQLATEKLVREFVESMSKNPMLGAMAKMMGGKR